jgi:inner membrane protein involved in colicin E2 resistance
MGVVTPTRIQPGELASEMSYSAPISLGFFMLWMFVLSLLRGIDLHPINHLFLAAAFFSFHLLFAYTADRLPVEGAFALASVVSVTLVVSYLRLVVGPAFALREAGLAQMLYLVGFSLAHFWDGYTGLTVTVLGILTLFVLMQMTGRIRWSEMLAARTEPAAGR